MSIRKSKKFCNVSNWFSRTESFLIMNILKIAVELQNHLDTLAYFELAVMCLTVFTSEQKLDVEFVFRHIIFSTKFYTSDVLMKNLNINEESESSLNDLNSILDVYSHVLGLKVSTCFEKYCSKINVR